MHDKAHTIAPNTENATSEGKIDDPEGGLAASCDLADVFAAPERRFDSADDARRSVSCGQADGLIFVSVRDAPCGILKRTPFMPHLKNSIFFERRSASGLLARLLQFLRRSGPERRDRLDNVDDLFRRDETRAFELPFGSLAARTP